MSASDPVNTVLVYVGLDRIGDSLLKLPFVRGLRSAYPDANITWLAGKGTSVYAGIMAPVVAGLLDEVIECAGIGLSPKELLRRPLHGRGFDLIIDTQRVALASFVLWHIRHKQFVSPFGKFILSTKKPPEGYQFPKSMQRQVLDLLEIASGQTIPTPKTLDLALDPELERIAETLLPDGTDYVGFAPGAGGLPKCWPLENFITAANGIGAQPVFFLGPQETDWIETVRSQCPDALLPLQENDVGSAHDFAPQLTIAMARRLRLAVSNDSGTGHMFAVSGAPLISLFGRTVPEKFTPMASRLTIIRAQDYGGREMHLIPVAVVIAAIRAELGRQSGSGQI
jgi:ADP-heptose:LPS heptosyltransferase